MWQCCVRHKVRSMMSSWVSDVEKQVSGLCGEFQLSLSLDKNIHNTAEYREYRARQCVSLTCLSWVEIDLDCTLTNYNKVRNALVANRCVFLIVFN